MSKKDRRGFEPDAPQNPNAPEPGGDAFEKPEDLSLKETVCPTCGGKRRVQKLHCVQHDFLYDAGSECDHCAAERENPPVPVTDGPETYRDNLDN